MAGRNKGIHGEKIIKLGVADLVLSLHNEGYSARAISKHLKKLGYDVSDQTIRNFLQVKDAIIDSKWEQTIKEIQKAEEKAIEQKKNSLSRFYDTLREVDELIEHVRDNPVLLNNLYRTRIMILSNIAKLEASVIKNEMLKSIFEELSLELGKLFKEFDLPKDIVESVAVVINKVYSKYVRS